MKRIAILGSTGSIGINTLDVISRMRGDFRVVALSADSNVELLGEQSRKTRPKVVCVGNGSFVKSAKKLIPSGVRVVCGQDGLAEIVSRSDIDLVVFAISGNACLASLIKAIENRKEIALANKESLVSGGQTVMTLAKRKGVKIIPIDSEHSAIFQCLEGDRRDSLFKVYLTGSGGPLLNVPKSRFDSLQKRFILNHPRWKMGKKISIDSATMMNKGLEIIEAKHLFGLEEKDIEVLIHPEAIIHSMIEMVDGAIFAQMGVPDMRGPIQYALTYPGRKNLFLKRLDLVGTGKLSFYNPDIKKFPCLELAREALRRGGLFPAVMCASDEVAVDRYLKDDIKFSDIPRIIEKVFNRYRQYGVNPNSIKEILRAEEWAREEARSICCH